MNGESNTTPIMKKFDKSPQTASSSQGKKKMVQSRLSFRSIQKEMATPTSSVNASHPCMESYKAKLMYTSEDENQSAVTAEEKNEATQNSTESFRVHVVGAKKRRKEDSKDWSNIRTPGDRDNINILELSHTQDTTSCGMNPQKKFRLSTSKSSETVENDHIQISSAEKNEKCANLNPENKDDNKDEELLVLSTTVSESSDAEGKSDTISENDAQLETKENIKTDNAKTNPKKPTILTDKKKRLSEICRKAREIKELELQEKQQRRQREKEARELRKKLEHEQKKAELRRKQEKREEKRLAELEEKSEVKRKRREAKEEEQRRKNDERKRKEQEKEEAELKKRRAAEAFTKFFVNKATSSSRKTRSIEDSEDLTLAFRPFQVKDDMRIAPISRVHFTEVRHRQLDEYLVPNENSKSSPPLYLEEMRSGQIIPGASIHPVSDNESEDDDMIIVEEETNRICQSIKEEHSVLKRQRYRAKFYKFHDNRRPPYYGTWRKHSKVIRPRYPFARDETVFNYEIDSDDEWEEDEPGEALDDSEGDKENESEEDDYEVDNEWFVPHGHLSEEELQNADDEYNATPESQKTKLQLLQLEFAQQMKKKTEKIKPRLIGCIWANRAGEKPLECPRIIWESLCDLSMLICGTLTQKDIELEPAMDAMTPTPNVKRDYTLEKEERVVTFTDSILEKLARLVHGNYHSKNFLVKEFLAYLEENKKLCNLSEELQKKNMKMLIRDKISEIANWQVVYVEQEKSLSKGAPKRKKYLCWVIGADVLARFGLQDLSLKNTWRYVLQPKAHMLQTEGKDIKIVLPSSETDSSLVGNMEIGDDEMPVLKGQISSKENASNASVAAPAKNRLISQFLRKSNNKMELA